MPDTEFMARMDRDSRRLKRVILFCVVAASVMLAVPAFAQEAHYGKDGPAVLPDTKISPGDVAITDKSKLCPHANTKARRHVTKSEKVKVCAEYGIPASKCNGKNYEIDHIVSLELGGSNSVANLFPQPWWPHPAAHDKDKLENWTHKQVCDGKMSLSDAQQGIATDWFKLYQQMKASKAKHN